MTTYHAVCLDCDAQREAHYDGDNHCDVCEEPWPCEHAGEVSEHTPAHWSEGNGEDWCRPDALVLVWNGENVSEGADRLRKVLLHKRPEYDLLSLHTAILTGGTAKWEVALRRMGLSVPETELGDMESNPSALGWDIRPAWVFANIMQVLGFGTVTTVVVPETDHD